MPDITKIDLSDYEAAMLRDENIILTKRSALKKVENFLGMQVDKIQMAFIGLKPLMDEPLLSAIPKVSRGENYQGLPWVMLDYPAVFSKQDVFALRSFFWWGNYFSIYLHVSGRYKSRFENSILNKLNSEPGDFYLSIKEDPWQHHFNEDNYVRISGMEAGYAESYLQKCTHLKLALKFDLNNWELIPPELQKGYTAVSHLLGAYAMK